MHYALIHPLSRMAPTTQVTIVFEDKSKAMWIFPTFMYKQAFPTAQVPHRYGSTSFVARGAELKRLLRTLFFTVPGPHPRSFIRRNRPIAAQIKHKIF